MTFKELKENLATLTEDQLGMEVIVKDVWDYDTLSVTSFEIEDNEPCLYGPISGTGL